MRTGWRPAAILIWSCSKNTRNCGSVSQLDRGAAPGRLDELGVGTGRFAGPLGIEVGVEPARAMAEIASTRGLGVIQGYAEAPPFADGSFDFVLMVTVLCFLKDPVQALGEATRVLKAQGRLIVGMIDPESPLGKLYEANQAKSKFYRNARFHPVSQGLVWLRDLGYENVMTCQTLYQDTSDIAKPDPVKKAMEREVL